MLLMRDWWHYSRTEPSTDQLPEYLEEPVQFRSFHSTLYLRNYDVFSNKQIAMILGLLSNSIHVMTVVYKYGIYEKNDKISFACNNKNLVCDSFL